MSETRRPLALLIGALGGEGGGVLTQWVVSAAMNEDYPVQSTSIPGVAQRTGATTYYVEVYPVKSSALGDAYPVMALYPGPGNVDVVVASELLEAGRALELGFVSPDRTTLIASTHRVYAVAEKAQMGDGTYDASRIVEAATTLAARPMLANFSALARERKVSVNALLLGIIAGSGALPIARAAFEHAIRDGGIAVEANLAGFRAGLAVASSAPAAPEADAAEAAGDVAQEQYDRYPEPVREVLGEAHARVVDFQDATYGEWFLARLEPVLEAERSANGGDGDWALTREAARYLALWMSYEDVARVAELKSRASRMAHVRATVGATDAQPVRVTEFFKPGIDEICAILPRGLARQLRGWASTDPARRGHLSMRVRTDTVLGYLQLRSVAWMKRWRRRSERYAEEQALIERWLEAVLVAARTDCDLALEIVECANLNKGYGETFLRGRGNFLRIMETVVEPALRAPDGEAASRVRAAREAALADPEGIRLGQVLVAPPSLPVSVGSN